MSECLATPYARFMRTGLLAHTHEKSPHDAGFFRVNIYRMT